MANNYDDSDGVWRTIGGRRVFIKNGQSLSDAMKESGKFKKSDLKKNTQKYEKELEKEPNHQAEEAHREFEKEYEKKKEEAKASFEKNEEKIKKMTNDLGIKKEKVDEEKNTTNARTQIQEIAKASKEDYVTLDSTTGEVVKFDKGYSVSFQQSSDNYTDEEFNEKVNECKAKCDGKLYAGKYGGDAEPSFHTDSLDDAKEIMYKYNQESIYDWEHDTFIINDKYDASKNQTNAEIPQEKVEKTTNETMNEKIRAKASKKSKTEPDLPKRTEIKEQGTSNRKEVSENIQAHILDYYDSPQDFIDQMDAMSYLPTKWKQGEELARGGSYLIYNQDMSDFLDELKINPKGKKFSEDKAFDMYTSLIGRESAKLYDRLQKNAYKEYMKEHPLSKMSFEEFKDRRRG